MVIVILYIMAVGHVDNTIEFIVYYNIINNKHKKHNSTESICFPKITFN